MKNIEKYKIIITTTNSLKDIESIKKNILLKKISPCIQVINNIESSYIWKNEIVSDNEAVIFIKTTFRNEQYY